MVSDVNSIKRNLDKLRIRLLALQEQRINLLAELKIAKLRNNYYKENWREKRKGKVSKPSYQKKK